MTSHKSNLFILSILALSIQVNADYPPPLAEPPSQATGKEPGSQAGQLSEPVHKTMGKIFFHQYPVAPAIDRSATEQHKADAISGYEAFKNVLLAAVLLKSPQEIQSIYAEALLSTDYRALFAQEDAPWPTLVRAERGTTLAGEYIEDTLYLAIKGAQKQTYEQMTSMNVTPLNLDEKHVVSYDNYTYETNRERQAVTHIVKLTKAVANQLAKAHAQGNSVSLTQETIFFAYEMEAERFAATHKNSTIVLDRTLIEKSFPTLAEIAFSLERGFNEVTLAINNSTIVSRTFGPAQAA